MRIFILLTFIVLSTVACKHKHEASPELKKAFAIQNEALEINNSLDALEIPSSLQVRRTAWLKGMIEVPGMEHDHKNCSHDHSHNTTHVTDIEMIAVQQAWKDSIVNIKKKILLEAAQ